MTIPARPRVQHQGPASNCVIDGRLLGWLSCTAYAGAHLVDRSTLGRRRPTGCEVRARTGDTQGGLTLPQVAKAIQEGWGVPVEVHVGSGACTPEYAALQARAGRGFILQGGTGPLLNTPFRSTNTAINHAVYVNEVRGGTAIEPAEALVYDPAADGRRTGIDEAASWWLWSLVKRFAGALHPWGENDARTLGVGRMYAGFGPDTEPHVHLLPGARPMTTLPNRKRVKAGYRVRRTPNGEPIAKTVAGIWEIWQAFDGTPPSGSSDRRWWGSHAGDRWIHNSALVR